MQRIRQTKEWAEVNVENLLGIAQGFYDFIVKNVKPLKDVLVSKKVSLKTLRQSKPNLLARPVGLVLLADVYRHFASTDRLPVLAKRIGGMDFSQEGQFDGLLWNNGRIEAKNLPLAIRLALYLLGELAAGDLADLKTDYAVATKQSRELPPRLKTSPKKKKN